LVASVHENPDLAAALTHPAIASDRRKSIGLAICASAGASETLTRLLQMLIEREKVAWLPEIAGLYTELWNAHRGVARAEATTTTTLDGNTLTSLGTALGKATGLAVDVTGRTDPSVLGGVVVRMGGKTFDGTVLSRLRLLRQTLTQGA
jgi:F-type H+-transporting ATPase subunit delta